MLPGAGAFSERKPIAADIAHVIVPMMELDDRGFVTKATVWGDEPGVATSGNEIGERRSACA
jgi:hypothetical protein